MKIGEVARRTGVTVPTLRYYERRELITATRTKGNYRQFGDDVVARIGFIKHAQSVGFDLENVRELLHLRDAEEPDRDRVRRLTERKLDDIEKQLAELARAQELLRGLLAACRGEAESPCPILAGLSGPPPNSKDTATEDRP